MLTEFFRFKRVAVLNEMVLNDKCDRAAANKIRKSFIQITTNYGFFSRLLFNLAIMEVDSDTCETMCTDGKSIGYYAPFVNELTEEEVMFVLVHEVMHNANLHFARQGSRDHDLWNQAADYSINIMIDDMSKEMVGTTAKLKAPQNILLDDQYRGMNAEQVYKILEKNPKQQQQGQGQGGQGKPGKGKAGKGKPGPGQAGGTPAGDIRAPGTIAGEEIFKPEPGQEGQGNKDLQDAKSISELEKIWKEIRSNEASKSRSMGVGSSALSRWFEEFQPKIDWRNELQEFVTFALKEKTKLIPTSRRFVWTGDYISGYRDQPKESFDNVVVAIDTSGSISNDVLSKFAAELNGIFKDHEIGTCYVIWCDSDIPKDGVQKFDMMEDEFSAQKLKPKGGGGTSFIPPFKWVQDNILEPGQSLAFMIYFTDAEGTAPSPGQYDIGTYEDRVLWVITQIGTEKQGDNLKFGRKLYIPIAVD